MELDGKTVGIIAADDFEDIELLYTYYRILESGANAKIIGIEMSSGTVRGKHGYTIPIDLRAGEARPEFLDALIVPGGWAPDRLTWCSITMQLIVNSFNAGKITAAISKGVWVLACAELLKGKKVTSDPSIRNNLKNSGADWLDDNVVVDNNIITARSSSDLPYFCMEIIKALETK